MLTKELETAINNQIADEFYAAHLYLSMAAHFELNNLPGFAQWMRAQYQEETAHALKLFELVLGTRGIVRLRGVKQPPQRFGTVTEVMEQALAHEVKVTKAINKLYEKAVKEKAYAIELQLQWFISEQVEEERTVADIIAQLNMAGEDGPALLLIDRQLAGRGAGQAGTADG